MTINFRKAMLVLSTIVLTMQILPMPIGMVYAETIMDTESSDKTLTDKSLSHNYLEQEEIVSDSSLLNFLNISEKNFSEYSSTESHQETISEESNYAEKEEEKSQYPPEVKQMIPSNGENSLKSSIETLSSINFEQMKQEDHRSEISFIINTFKAEVNQSIGLILLLKSTRSEFDIRIPSEAKVDWQNMPQGIEITHQEGEYWRVQVDYPTDVIEIPVIFDSAGAFFLSVDHDDNHIYIDVRLPSGERKTAVKTVVDAHLSIPEEIEEKEKSRILGNVFDENRSSHTVSSWSQFRTAWNNSGASIININGRLSFSSSILGDSLNTRSSTVTLTGGTLNMGNSGYSLVMNGNVDLVLSGVTVTDTPGGILISDNRRNPVIIHNGNGNIILNNLSAVEMTTGTPNSVVRGQNILLENFAYIASQNNSASSSRVNAASIEILRGGTLTIRNPSRRAVLSSTEGVSGIKPIISDSTSTIVLEQIDRLSMGTARGINQSSAITSWSQVDAILSGVNGNTVLSSQANPNDFEERYLSTFTNPEYGSLIFNGSGSEWVDPPVLSYNLLLEASPIEGGKPTTEASNIQHGSTTNISANPNEGYAFVHWKIISGTGSNIASLTSETTTFTMGSQDTIIQAVYEEAQVGEIHVYHTDIHGQELIDPVIITGSVGEAYNTEPVEIKNYYLLEVPENAIGVFTNGTISVVYIYKIKNIDPLDPLDPEIEVDLENKPELPEDQGQLSVDFISSFDFGSQAISVHDQTYYAKPQRLLNEDGTVNETEERPNYVQISDRRSENDRNGWTLAVTQKEQFKGEENQVLNGASLSLSNQQVITAQGGEAPGLQSVPCTLVPGNRRTLLHAQGYEGTGTWIYRFGDGETAGESVALDVPRGANPEATTYSTSLIWELSAVPGN